MTKTTKSAVRRQRPRGAFPAGWTPHRGRWRWLPSPTLRRAGWRPVDLRDPKTGDWLSEGQSLDRARWIVAQVAAWRRGEVIPADCAAFAPAGSCDAGPAVLPVATDRLSIGKLLEAYQASPEFARLKPKTQFGYRHDLKRLVDALAGFAQLPDKSDPDALARHEFATALVKSKPVSILAPAETATGMVNLLYDAYWALHDKGGPHRAYQSMAAAGAWLTWCGRFQSASVVNWTRTVRRDTPPGRIRVLSWDEVKALVQAADRLGLPEIGDSIVLGVDLSWSQTDRLHLTWDRLRNDVADTGQTGRRKTGRRGGAPLTALGLARVAEIRARQADMDAKPLHVIWSARLGGPMNHDDGSFYRKRFAEVRAEAAKACPSVADATDADLRDTAFTWMEEAGLDDTLKASRTLQSRANMKQLADRHYGEIGPALSDEARRRYDAHLAAKGYSL
jgi:integrase